MPVFDGMKLSVKNEQNSRLNLYLRDDDKMYWEGVGRGVWDSKNTKFENFSGRIELPRSKNITLDIDIPMGVLIGKIAHPGEINLCNSFGKINLEGLIGFELDQTLFGELYHDGYHNPSENIKGPYYPTQYESVPTNRIKFHILFGGRLNITHSITPTK